MSSTPDVRPGAPNGSWTAPRHPVAPSAGAQAPQAPHQPKARHDPRAFAERVKLLAIGGSVAGFGVVWSLVTANVVGVTSHSAAPAGTTGTGGPSEAKASAAPQRDQSFFQGAGVQAPSFVGGNASTPGSASGATSGSSSRTLPTVGGFGDFGGPLVVSGSS